MSTPAVELPDEVRQTPVSPSLLRSINETLDSLPAKTATAVLQVPVGGRLRGGVYVNVGDGMSFMGWLEKDMSGGFGGGVAVRKAW
jgi:hypothetical protein